MQELLDREALEKVNVSLFLLHIHELRAEGHMPETALTADRSIISCS